MFAKFEKLLAGPMRSVDETIHDRLRSDVVLINQLGGYIVAGGGKRLRPRLVLMAAGAAGYTGNSHITVAAIVEFIHTATLLHDDVVDSSSMRRGQETANVVWGNEAAVLVGDFLYSRAFEMMVEVGSMRVMEILAGTTNTIAEGEVMQLMHVHDPDISESQYFNVIRCKTAKLFEAAAQIGAVKAEYLLVEPGDAGRCVWWRVQLHVGHAKIHARKRARLVRADGVAIGAGQLEMIVSFSTVKARVVETTRGKLEAFSQSFQIRHHDADVPPQYLGFVSRQVKLLIAEVHPHVEGAEIDVRVTRETEPGYVKHARDTLIGHRQIDVLQHLHVADVLLGPVEVFRFSHGGSPRTCTNVQLYKNGRRTAREGLGVVMRRGRTPSGRGAPGGSSTSGAIARTRPSRP